MVLLKPQNLHRIACISYLDLGPNFSQLGFFAFGTPFLSTDSKNPNTPKHREGDKQTVIMKKIQHVRFYHNLSRKSKPAALLATT